MVKGKEQESAWRKSPPPEPRSQQWFGPMMSCQQWIWGFPYAGFMSPAYLPDKPPTLTSSSCSSLLLSHAPCELSI